MADFEVLSEIAVSSDGAKLHFAHPDGPYDCYLKNTTISDGAGSSVLRMQIEYEAASLDAAKDACMEYLVEALNFLSFTTNARFEFSRLLHVFDWTSGLSSREGFIFNREEPADNPQPFLDRDILRTIEVFLRAKPSPEIGDAMRWFRLGVSSQSPEEQFQDFWFALEIVAEDQKKPGKVHDLCARCKEPLYCEKCGEYPKHRPYPKQAIEQLVTETAPDFADLFKHLNDARNTLLHGGRLEVVEERLGYRSGRLVDLLGKLTWHALLKVLVKSLPKEVFPFKPSIGAPTKYVHSRIGVALRVAAVVPKGADGKPDIERFAGIGGGFERR